MSISQHTEAYSAHISVTFGDSEPFVGVVYVQGDGNHAVFSWPAQTNTPKTTELAEFKTQTKWVTNEEGCIKSKFKDPDPKFVGMVSHENYKLVSDKDRKRVYSLDGITCTYNIDGQDREAISSIVFQGAKIAFTKVAIGTQDPSLFKEPSNCKETE